MKYILLLVVLSNFVAHGKVVKFKPNDCITLHLMVDKSDRFLGIYFEQVIGISENQESYILKRTSIFKNDMPNNYAMLAVAIVDKIFRKFECPQEDRT